MVLHRPVEPTPVIGNFGVELGENATFEELMLE
jgi:hypothetical protein